MVEGPKWDHEATGYNRWACANDSCPYETILHSPQCMPGYATLWTTTSDSDGQHYSPITEYSGPHSEATQVDIPGSELFDSLVQIARRRPLVSTLLSQRPASSSSLRQLSSCGINITPLFQTSSGLIFMIDHISHPFEKDCPLPPLRLRCDALLFICTQTPKCLFNVDSLDIRQQPDLRWCKHADHSIPRTLPVTLNQDLYMLHCNLLLVAELRHPYSPPWSIFEAYSAETE